MIDAKMPAFLRRHVDPEDIALEAAADLAFHPALLGHVNPTMFVNVLARHRIVYYLRFHGSKKRCREVAWPTVGATGRQLDVAGPDDPAGRVADAADLMDRLLSGLDPDEQAVVRMKAAGHANPEVARAVGWGLRRVQRLLKAIRLAI